MRLLYLIDGVSVPKWIWEVRQLWGETPSARFTVQEIAPRPTVTRRSR